MVIFHGELSVYPGDDPSDASLGEKTMGIRLGDGAGVGSKGSQDIAKTTKKQWDLKMLLWDFIVN